MMVGDQEAIKSEVVSFFSNPYQDPKSHNLSEQSEVLHNLLRYFMEEDQQLVGGPISSEKVEVSLKACARYKSMGLNGWTMEFYFHFLDLSGGDLVLSIENS